MRTRWTSSHVCRRSPPSSTDARSTTASSCLTTRYDCLAALFLGSCVRALVCVFASVCVVGGIRCRTRWVLQTLDISANFARMLGFNDHGFDELMRLYLVIHSDHEVRSGTAARLPAFSRRLLHNGVCDDEALTHSPVVVGTSLLCLSRVVTSAPTPRTWLAVRCRTRTCRSRRA